MVAVTHDATSAVVAPVMYVDGADKSAGAVASASGSATWNLLGDSAVALEDPWSGPIQHVAVFPRVLSSVEVYALYVAATNASAGDATHTQVGNVLTIAGWPASWRTLSTASLRVLDYIDTASSNAWDVLNKIVASEQGQLFVDRNGYVVYMGAWDLYAATRSATSQFTFSDAGTASTVPYTDTGLDLDDSHLANYVVVRTSNGQPAMARNATSIALYGQRTVEIDTRLQTVLEAQQVANYRLARYSIPQARLRDFTVRPQRSPAYAFPKMLGLEIADRVTIRSQPGDTGSVSNAEYWVEGIQHEFRPGEWLCRVSASAVPGGSYWTLDSSPFDSASTRLQ